MWFLSFLKFIILQEYSALGACGGPVSAGVCGCIHIPLNIPLPSCTQKRTCHTPHCSSKPNPPTHKDKTFIYLLEGGPGHLPRTSPVVLGKSHILLSSSASATSHFTKLNFKQRDLRFKSAYRDGKGRASLVTHPAKLSVSEQGEQSRPTSHSQAQPRTHIIRQVWEVGQQKNTPQVKVRSSEGNPGQTPSSNSQAGPSWQKVHRSQPEAGDVQPAQSVAELEPSTSLTQLRERWRVLGRG